MFEKQDSLTVVYLARRGNCFPGVLAFAAGTVRSPVICGGRHIGGRASLDGAKSAARGTA